MQDFRKLEVWAKAHGLSVDLYRATRSFPAEEKFGLTSQMRRAAVSISSNIAEGCGRGGSADMARFLQMSIGSACELECQLLLAVDLGFLDTSSATGLLEKGTDVRRMLIALRGKVLQGSCRELKTPHSEPSTQN